MLLILGLFLFLNCEKLGLIVLRRMEKVKVKN